MTPVATRPTPDEITASAMKHINKLGKLDPVERVEAAAELHEALLDLSAAVATHRRAAVRELRSQGYTQVQVADMLGVSATRVQQIEHGITSRDKAKYAKGDELIRKWAGKA